MMSSPFVAPPLDVELRPGRIPLLRVDPTGDAPGWAARHRDALRAVVAEHCATWPVPLPSSSGWAAA
jgi:hypothetical protein